MSGFSRTIEWFANETGVSAPAAEQAIAYLAAGHQALGALPTQDTLILERFFDESGGMQLVLHAPFGSRINKAWGLALRKRFCRQFNFELQAAANEDALLLSLGPQHSFPLSDVFRYLHSATARDVLIQAFLDAPVFQTRWRWNTTISLAVPRNRNGRKVPPQLQRMLADDLMAAVFPDAAACLENIPGDREIPDHPLVNQTVRDCLNEAMDFDGLSAVLDRIHRGDLRLVARDTTEPSPLSHEILNARPYAFLDDAPLEERRTQAVYTRRATEPGSASELGALDAAAIARVRDEARPDPRDADELHDALVTAGFLTVEEVGATGPELKDTLRLARRAALAGLKPCATYCPQDAAPRAGQNVAQDFSPAIWVAAERLQELRAIHPELTLDPAIEPPASRGIRTWTREDAIVEILRGRLGIVGPTTVDTLAATFAIEPADIETALLALEAEGVAMRGSFSAPGQPEWCDRRLLARIHRYTLNRLRAEIEPVAPADFMRFLFAWQHVTASARLTGVDGLRAVIAQLDGYELAADAWERAVLPARIDGYEPSMLDHLCLTGEVAWARLTPSRGSRSGEPRRSSPEDQASGGGSAPGGDLTQLIGATPIALFLREHADRWVILRPSDGPHPDISEDSRRVLDVLRTRGASFAHDLAGPVDIAPAAIRQALGELVAAGLAASDGFGGLRSIVKAAGGRRVEPAGRSNVAGRWSLIHTGEDPEGAARESARLRSRDSNASFGAQAVELQARTLLLRYGVVFRKLLAREANGSPWRELTRVYRRLEARGEIRGGRFVAGMSGEQFALPEAVETLREIRRTAPDDRVIAISAADPLNLAGIVTTGDRVRVVAANRVAYRNGVPLAALEGDFMHPLTQVDGVAAPVAAEVATTLTGRQMPAVLSGFVGR